MICDPDMVFIVFAAIGGVAVAIPTGCALGWALIKLTEKLEKR